MPNSGTIFVEDKDTDKILQVSTQAPGGEQAVPNTPTIIKTSSLDQVMAFEIYNSFLKVILDSSEAYTKDFSIEKSTLEFFRVPD